MKDYRRNEELTDQEQLEIMQLLSVEVIGYITDKSIQNVIRHIMFDTANEIQWDKVKQRITKELPELTITR